MKLIIYGANHETLDVEKRERVSFGDNEIEGVLGELTGLSGIREATLLSTCNRTEFILVADELACVPKAVADLLRSKKNIDIEGWGDSFYYFEDGEASRHLFRVISSLDSMVLGEVEIIRQVKHAFTLASEAEICSIEDIEKAIDAADIVVTSLKYPDGYLLDASLLNKIDEIRQGGPITLVDISAPRVVEKPAETLSNILLFDIESLEAVRDEN